jgi:hypothetical protein
VRYALLFVSKTVGFKADRSAGRLREVGAYESIMSSCFGHFKVSQYFYPDFVFTTSLSSSMLVLSS